MAAPRSLDRPVQLRNDVSDEEDDLDGLEAAASEDDDDAEDDSSDSGHPQSEAQSYASSPSEADEEPASTDISFGALAKAQESLYPNPRKRKLDDAQQPAASGSQRKQDDDFFDTRKRSKEAPVQAPKRSSKHAPAVESARKPVSRKRAIFDPSAALKFRDPRFDPTVMSANRDRNAVDRANKNYSFLSTYQASEILELKSQIKKSKDPEAVAQLKRQVMSMEANARNAENRQKENEIRSKHKQQEKAALSAGQKSRPYYLKDAEVRKLINEERLQSMGKQARDKAEKRKMKREKGKEARDMPRARRDR
jgi:ribosomal RNA-processing protein 36